MAKRKDSLASFIIMLGLATCYSIAARHKARIDVDTGPNGTTFYVRFKA